MAMRWFFVEWRCVFIVVGRQRSLRRPAVEPK